MEPSRETSSPAFPIPPNAGPAYPLQVVNVDDVVFRHVTMMQASGWTLERHWPGGADFVSRESSSISLGLHLLLCLFTVGLWIPFMVIMELSSSGVKRTRLTVDEAGQPHYAG